MRLVILLLFLPFTASQPCATDAILHALNSQSCHSLTSRQVSQTLQTITHCLLSSHGLPAPSCLQYGNPSCISSLPPHAHATYERLSARWHILCAAATAVRTVSELTAAVQIGPPNIVKSDALKQARKEAQLAVERAMQALEAVADVQNILQQVLRGGQAVGQTVKDRVEGEGRRVKQVREGVHKLRRIVHDITSMRRREEQNNNKVKENETWFGDWMLFMCGIASGRTFVAFLVAALVTAVKSCEFVTPLVEESVREWLTLIVYVGRTLSVAICVGAWMWIPDDNDDEAVTEESTAVEIEESSPVFEE